MTRTLTYFLAGSAMGWLVLAGLCWLRWQEAGLVCCAVTGAICVLPTALSLLLTLRSSGKPGMDQLVAVVCSMLLRMGAALGVGVAVFLSVPYFREPGREYAYWGTLLIFYLFTLGLESFLAARFQPKTQAAPAAGART